MKRLINSGFKWYLAHHYKHIEAYMREPHRVQAQWLQHFISNNKHTEYGKIFGFESIKKYEDFAARLPIRDYEHFKPFIERMMLGEKDILWSGAIRWFSKSSGTTSDKSKYIPVTSENLKKCHIRGTWDAMSILYANHPDSLCFSEKTVLMGGSVTRFEPYPKTKIGDVSAIMMQHFPYAGRPFVTPDFDTLLMSNFEEKLERMAHILPKENLVMFGGVPTWTVVLIKRILELTGKNNLLEVWPNLEAYMHGGVSFEPYREQFKRFIPKENFNYQEIYNASEGFFGIQSDPSQSDMLLLLDNGIYYEFLPMSEWEKENPTAIPLWEVQEGVNYALVITTNSGLWRYLPGDTVMFTSTSPYKIKITGRTKQFINAFGEEVMVANTDKALSETCHAFDAAVAEYTVAPIYFHEEGDGKGGHEWIIEFEKPPHNIDAFNDLLDVNLQRINSDYEAKRYKSMALNRLKMSIVPSGTFYNWLKSKQRIGGQSKVPRLANDRKYVDDILKFATTIS
jgi:GH3 auxin-responsive promoter